METDSKLSPFYANSDAVVIGIDEYEHMSALSSAANDARAVAEVLQTHCGFPKVELLLNEAATRRAVLSTLEAIGSRTTPDDRVVIYFAGHGISKGRYGHERGFLMPWDHRPGDVSSLIRWEELRFSIEESFRAKHVLFLMDSCYSGLFLRRGMPNGVVCDLRRSLLKPVMQALTAGRGSQTVADSGGPLPGHSPFTGRLIEALKGAAADENGVITATRVMFYVSEHVRKDHEAAQTPGWHQEGDGDFVFSLRDGWDVLKRPEAVATSPVVEASSATVAAGCAQSPSKITVRLLSQDGTVKNVPLSPQATVQLLLTFAQDKLKAPDNVPLGRHGRFGRSHFSWALVDKALVDAGHDAEWPEDAVLYALIKVGDGVRATTNGRTTLEEAGIRDGMVLNLLGKVEYSSPASLRRPFGLASRVSLAASAARRARPGLVLSAAGGVRSRRN